MLAALLCIGCTGNMDYDLSKGISKEVTLFENEISVPVGSIGPLTIGSILSSLGSVQGIGTLVSSYIKQDAEGSLTLRDSSDIFRINVYELEKKAGDVSAPFTWNAGFQTTSIGGMAGALGFLGLKTVNQQVKITASNPLYNDVTFRCKPSVTCRAADFTTSYSGPIEGMSERQLKFRTYNEQIAEIKIPSDISDVISSITLEDLAFDLPANPSTKTDPRSNNLFFHFSYNYTCTVAVGETFKLVPVDGPIKGVNLPIGPYKVKKCRVNVELQNTLPLAVTIENLKALLPEEIRDEEIMVDENILISPETISIEGGSLENPATTNLTLELEAADGTLPDISGLRAKVTVASQPGLGTVGLSARQGLYVKSASAVISGGITIPEQQQ